MDSGGIFSRLMETDILFLIVGGTVAIIWIVLGTITSMVKSVARERTRREIAAYIAEGSMTPDQGERLMAAGRPKNE